MVLALKFMVPCIRVQLYRATDLQEERVRIICSLGATRDKALIQRTLDFAIGVSRDERHFCLFFWISFRHLLLVCFTICYLIGFGDCKKKHYTDLISLCKIR